MVRPERLRLLERMVQDAERRLDGQVSAARHADSTAGHLLAVGVAMLGFGVTLGLYVFQQGLTGPAFPLAFSISVIQNLTGIAPLVESFAGFRPHPDLFAAPEASWLEERMADSQWRIDSHLSSLVSSYATYAAANRLTAFRSARARRLGTVLLGTGAVSYLSSIFFILG